MKKQWILLPILMLFFAFGCAKKVDETVSLKGKLDKDGVLNLNLGAEPTFLNPILSTDSPSGAVNGMVFNGLLKSNADLDLVPDLAATYNISEGGRVYTFTLHDNIKWHDGNPLTAADVKFTFDTILDPKTNTVRRSNFIINGKPIRFEVVSRLVVRAALPQPFAPFLVHMTMGIIPRHLFENESVNTSSYNRKPVGSGPFFLKEWKSGQYVRMARNEHFFGERPKLKEILMKIIPDENTAIVALEKGEIDQAGIPAKDYSRFLDHEVLDMYRYYSLSYTYLGFNLKNPFFKDLRVREAIALAIDKNVIVKGVLKGFGKPAQIPASPVSWAYPDQGIKVFQHDPSQSKKLLNEAGYVLNPKTKILEKNGKPFEFTLITNKGNKDREKSAQIIQRFLMNVGIKANIQLMEWSAFIKIVNENSTNKKYDALILGWGLGLDPDGYSIWHSSQYPQGFNFIGYENKRVDELLEKGRLETDREKRKQVYHRIYNEIARDLPYIFLYHPESIVGINRRVRGLSKPGPAGMMNDIERVFVTK